MTRRVAALVTTCCLFALQVSKPHAIDGTCLEEAIPKGERRDILVDGLELPLGIWKFEWDSAELITAIFDVLVSEVLGFNTVLSGSSDACEFGIIAVSRCSLESTGTSPTPDCTNIKQIMSTHVALEFWDSTIFNDRWFVSNHPKEAPENMGSVGYHGSEGVFIGKRPVQAASDMLGAHLDFYGWYDASWFDPSAFFATPADIPNSMLMPCSESLIGNALAIQNVRTWTPDPEGFDESGRAKCHDGYWWRSPACRANTSSCVPFVSGGNGWILDQIMPKAIAFRMSIAVATAVNWSAYVALPTEHDTLFYSWKPALHFIGMGPKEIMFEQHDDVAWAQGDKRSSSKSVELQKVAFTGLQFAAYSAYRFLQEMTIPMQAMEELLKGMLRPGASYADIACEWVRDHREVWQSWVPLETSCSAGHGLVDFGGSFVTDRSTATSCSPCPAGSLSVPVTDALGDTFSCLECPPGSSQKMWGQDFCSPCEAGQHQNASGDVACLRCPQGRHQSERGSQECETCAPPRTTNFLGATSEQECLCPVDSFGSEDGTCDPCPFGFTCALGSSMQNLNRALDHGTDVATEPFPVLAPGLYTTQEQPLSAYKCSRQVSCPGGVPGTCSGGLVGLTCTHCPASHFLQNGECRDCSESHAGLVLALTASGMSGLALVSHMLVNVPPSRASGHVVVGGMMAGLVVNFVLTISIVGTLNVIWTNPLVDFFEPLHVLSFDIERFQLSCTIPDASFTTDYIMKLLAYPIVASSLLLSIGLLQFFPCARKGIPCSVSAIINSLGFVLSLAFIAVGLLSLQGFRCTESPNGRSTLSADSSVICWEAGEHRQVVMLGIVAVLVYPITFLALTFVACFFYASLSALYGIRFTACVRFLVVRVRPDLLIFAFLGQLKNFLISLLPTLTTNYHIQVCLMLIVLLLWSFLQLWFKFWRSHLINIVDAYMNFVTIIMLVGFALLSSEQRNMDKALVGWLTISLFLAATTASIVLVVCKMLSACHPSSGYSIFISHHKAAAAVYARHLKLVFQDQGCSRPFLDVDELDTLDNLSFAVKASRSVLVVLTDQIMERPWCAVEITSAWLNKKPMMAVDINSRKVDLSANYLQDVIKSFSAQDLAIFLALGIDEVAVRSAFDHVASLDRITVPLNSTGFRLPDEVVRHCLGEHFDKCKPSSYTLDPEKTVYIIFNTKDDLQCSVASVLCHLFRQSRWNTIACRRDVAISQTTFHAGKNLAVVVLISKDLPIDPFGMRTIAAVARVALPVVTVLSQETFSKPSQEQLDMLKGGSAFMPDDFALIEEVVPGVTNMEFVEALQPLYMILAWTFRPEQNEKLMQVEFQVIEERVEKKLNDQTRASGPTAGVGASASSNFVTTAARIV